MVSLLSNNLVQFMKVQMTTENHSNRTRGKAVWDVETVDIFCDMCIAKVDAENHLIAIRGAIPGAKGSIVTIKNSVKKA